MKGPATLALTFVALFGSSSVPAQYVWQAREAARATSPSSATAPTAVQGSGSGLMIFVDPVTGEIRPPEQEELRALARQPVMTGLAPEPPQMFTGMYGSTGIRLDPSFDSYMVAIKRPDGTLDMDCLPGRARALDAVAGSAAPTGTVQKKTTTLDEK